MYFEVAQTHQSAQAERLRYAKFEVEHPLHLS
jgi:hypothetical protein